MNVFTNKSFDNHEQVVFCCDNKTGLKAIIAIHDTRLGPALGGCRLWPYADEDAALTDVLRLSRSMTYKAAAGGLNLGGGKAVIIGTPGITSEAYFRTFGKFVNSLNGRYITAEDVNTNTTYMEWVNYETDFVTGIPTYAGGSGDPSPVTAYGVFVGIKAAVKKLKGSDKLKGMKVAVEGAGGNVGYHLCKNLYKSGAKIYASDINAKSLKRILTEFKAVEVKGDDIYKQDVDIFAPCALGASLNDKTIRMLKCAIVAGAANNQLDDDTKHSAQLLERGIIFAPDYVINAGGLFNVNAEVNGGGPEHAMAKTEGIYDSLLQIWKHAEDSKISSVAAANQLAEKRMSVIDMTKSIYSGATRTKKTAGDRMKAIHMTKSIYSEI